jgi:hypothetical protein
MTNAELQKCNARREKFRSMFADFHHIAGVAFYAFAARHSDPMEFIPVAVCPSPLGVYGSCDIIGCVDGKFARIPSKDCDLLIPTSEEWTAQSFALYAARFGITFGGTPAVKAA